jgi:deoxycytidine triphosphate deaminase
MVWDDEKIKRWATNGGVRNFDEKLVNSASIDLRMSEFVARPITVANGWCDPNQAIRYGDKAAMSNLWGKKVDTELTRNKPNRRQSK